MAQRELLDAQLPGELFRHALRQLAHELAEVAQQQRELLRGLVLAQWLPLRGAARCRLQ